LEDPDTEEEDGSQKTQSKAQTSSRAQGKLHLEAEDKSLSEHEKEMVRVRNSAKKIKRNLDEA